MLQIVKEIDIYEEVLCNQSREMLIVCMRRKRAATNASSTKKYKGIHKDAAVLALVLYALRYICTAPQQRNSV